jgi:hypothetical protein
MNDGDDLDDDWDGRPPPDIRARTLREGIRLGLPRAWLGALPEVDALPGRYLTQEPDYHGDAFLAWKAQEHLVRTGRLAECDPDLVAEALEDAATHDGPACWGRYLRQVMFYTAWPIHSYHLGCQLDMAIELLGACLHDAPSMWLDIEADWQDRWWSVWHHALSLLGVEEAPTLPETCPWPTLPDLLVAARARVREEERRNWLGARA